jgi:hypothetical protein
MKTTSYAPFEGESYQRLVQMIKDKNSCDEQTAHRLARNLMGYVELTVKVAHREEKAEAKKAKAKK